MSQPIIPEDLQLTYDSTYSLAVRSLIERIGRVEHERDMHALNAVNLMRERDEWKLNYALADSNLPLDFSPDLETVERIDAFAKSYAKLVTQLAEMQFKYQQPKEESEWTLTWDSSTIISCIAMSATE